jgi:hypothetical protein
MAGRLAALQRWKKPRDFNDLPGADGFSTAYPANINDR